MYAFFLPKFNLLPFLYFSFVCVISLSQTGSTLSYVLSRSDCHLTLITLTHLIKNDLLLLKMIIIDSWGNCPL